ncbi:unnamed protein product [Brachionus calyciflorus]|uniref:Uncharacterized protein n=1 Tax=Brachionus calyciflorus TaxID=104777 RepID=A0A814GTW7_9BILA|nr:unnamed protein product [Brachionus calyciflorus]
MSGRDSSTRMIQRLPENFDKEGIETIKNLAKRLEAYAIHLEDERNKDALKLNKKNEDLVACESALEKSKNEVKSINELNIKLDSDKEVLKQKYNKSKDALNEKMKSY